MVERKKLLLVGDGDSIFFINYVKALKKNMDIEVHVYSPFPYNGDNQDLPYDTVYFDNMAIPSYKIKRVLFFQLRPYLQSLHFKRYIKEKYFDIIHIHRLLPAWVIISDTFKNYCDKLFLSFWGGEIDREVLFGSHELYLKKLEKLVNSSDCVVGSLSDKRISERFSSIKEKAHLGLFGSSIIDILCKTQVSSNEAKEVFGIPKDKISVLLGYSGKEIHNHCKILDEIQRHPNYDTIKDKIHFVASMTRGATPAYIKRLEENLQGCGCTYTVIKNCYQSDNDVALLRRATDVFFQLSTSDYLSASVKENLCAGAIMVSGNWLPYKILQDEGFKFMEVGSITEGINEFYDIINNIGNYQEYKYNNKLLCSSKYTWDACIKDWVMAYVK